MGLINLPTTLTDNTIPTAAQFNGDFTTIYNEFNGNITNANISASAAIATSKINATFPSGTILGTTDTQTLTNKTIGDTLNMTTGNINQSGAAAHITLTPGTSKLVKLAALRQDDTTNVYSNNQVILTGWGYISGSSSIPRQEETVTFGITFATPPIIITSQIGVRLTASGAPTGPDSFTTQPGSGSDVNYVANSYAASTTGFKAVISNVDATNLSAYSFGYSWIAIGTLP